MNPETAIELFRHALYVALMLSAPMLGGGLVIGLAVSIFQAVTQIHEATLTFIPKIAVVVFMLIVFLPWMTQTLLGFTSDLFALMASVGPR